MRENTHASMQPPCPHHPPGRYLLSVPDPLKMMCSVHLQQLSAAQATWLLNKKHFPDLRAFYSLLRASCMPRMSFPRNWWLF